MTHTPCVDLRFGTWQSALEGVECDALIVDGPFSARTHKGHDGGTGQANRVRTEDEKRLRVDRRRGTTYAVGANRRRALNFEAWTPEDVDAFVEAWHPRTRGWFVTLTDHVLAPAWARALEAVGRYVFSPIACVDSGSRVRLTGDGPAQWSCFAIVARPRSPKFSRWGALPGAYVLPKGMRKVGAPARPVVGGKPLWLMRQLVAHYSRPGELVCDPCAGGGTTMIAAHLEGRAAVGAERLRENFKIAQKRIDDVLGLYTASEAVG